jgi:hypothetical protein
MVISTSLNCGSVNMSAFISAVANPFNTDEVALALLGFLVVASLWAVAGV